MQAYRPGTQKNRWSHAVLYIAFCIYFGFADFPAAPGVLLMFAEFLTRSYTATKSVTNALSSLRTFHLIHGFSPLAFDHFQVTLWRRALPLTERSIPSQAPPLTVPLLQRLCIRARGMGRGGLAFAALLATCFYSLARLSSLVSQVAGGADDSRVPLVRDLGWERDRVILSIKWGKTRQATSQGFRVPLLHVPGAACPYTLLASLVVSLRGSPPSLPLFSYRQETGNGSTWVSFDLNSARSFLAVLLRLEGLQGRGFTFHSLRRGGCTLGFQGGAQLSDLQLLGGWRSRAIDEYYPHLLARTRAAQVLARGSR